MSKNKIDFWEMLFIHCIILSETEILKEEDVSDPKKSTTRAISIFTTELLEHSNYVDIEL